MQDVISFLSQHIGTTYANGFREFAETTVTPAPGMPPMEAPDLIRWTSRDSYEGDITLRSVTIVPEPDTWTLMGLGLSLLGLATSRRQRKQVSA